MPFVHRICPKRFVKQNNFKQHCNEKHNCNIDVTDIDNSYNLLTKSCSEKKSKNKGKA